MVTQHTKIMLMLRKHMPTIIVVAAILLFSFTFKLGRSVGFSAGIEARPQQFMCFLDKDLKVFNIIDGKISKGCPNVMEWRERQNIEGNKNGSE